MTTYYTIIDSPVDPILLVSDGESLTNLWMTGQKERVWENEGWIEDAAIPPLAEAARQLKAYFAGDLTEFDLRLAPDGTDFQKRVWDELTRIPYGETINYGQLAQRIGSPNASRAVGMANSRNPIGIIVPCHRVIGANGALTGYAGGLSRKKILLEHELCVAGA